jgi:hypothetical protein
MKNKICIIISLCLSLQLQTSAQSVKDSCIRILMVGIHFSGQLPKYDLEKRFGPNINAGANFTWKTKHNVLFSVEGSYFFGSNVKEDVVAVMRNESGNITDNEGYPADLRLTERGWNFYGNVGYMFSKLGNNPNSGLFVTVGAGWTQHKIKLYDANQKIAAVKGDLQKGYDRLSGGFGLSQFIGYKYISNNRFANCYFGFEFYEASTKSLRGFNYDTGLEDTQQRFDMLMGFRLGWILPLYKRTKDFYYN